MSWCVCVKRLSTAHTLLYYTLYFTRHTILYYTHTRMYLGKTFQSIAAVLIVTGFLVDVSEAQVVH